MLLWKWRARFSGRSLPINYSRASSTWKRRTSLIPAVWFLSGLLMTLGRISSGFIAAHHLSWQRDMLLSVSSAWSNSHSSMAKCLFGCLPLETVQLWLGPLVGRYEAECFYCWKAREIILFSLKFILEKEIFLENLKLFVLIFSNFDCIFLENTISIILSRR